MEQYSLQRQVLGFAESFYNNFKSLEASLAQLLKQEELMHEHFLVKSGFVIHRHSVKISSLKREELLRLKEEIQNILRRQEILKKDVGDNIRALITFERIHAESMGKLHARLLPHHLNDALRNAKTSLVRIDELLKLLEKRVKLYTRSDESDAARIILSIERMTNQQIKFISLIKQTAERLRGFKEHTFYETPKMYGRAMSLGEYKKTVKTDCLSSKKDPVPVFDSPVAVTNKVLRMSSDERKDFFGKIGVEGGFKLVFFETRQKPVNADNPIPQSNGLREYKFPAGMPIQILKAA
ncbi:MAG: hypothetical protein KJ574_02015 [Nanoarchaeota archaeon]|nr:hypothetical protein [Nanoarchaeota archaeon]